jgi:hypothetical protein
MRRALASSIPTLLFALLGCDPEGGTDDDTEFRQTITYVQMQTQTASFSSKSCDPEWWVSPAAGPDVNEFDEKEWMAMIHTEARMMGDEMLLRTFLAHPKTASLCKNACYEAGVKWTGGAMVTDSVHEVGETEITGECPYGLVATESPTKSVGKMACECA